jgi:hypothetical protein
MKKKKTNALFFCLILNSCIFSPEFKKMEYMVKIGLLNFDGTFEQIQNLGILSDTAGVDFKNLVYSGGAYDIRVEFNNSAKHSERDYLIAHLSFKDSLGIRFVDSTNPHGFKITMKNIGEYDGSRVFQTRYAENQEILGKSVFLVSRLDVYTEADDYYIIPANHMSAHSISLKLIDDDY